MERGTKAGGDVRRDRNGRKGKRREEEAANKRRRKRELGKVCKAVKEDRSALKKIIN